MLINTGIMYFITNNNLYPSDTDKHILPALVLYIKYFSSLRKKKSRFDLLGFFW